MNSSSFIQKYFIHLLIISGFAGFSIALLVYIRPSPFHFGKHYTFHEPGIDKNAVIDSFNQHYFNRIAPAFRNYDSVQQNRSFDTANRNNRGSSKGMSKAGIDSVKRLRNSLPPILKIKDDEERKTSNDFMDLQKDAYRKYRPGKIIKFLDHEQVRKEIEAKRQNGDTSNYSLGFLMYDSIHQDFPLKLNIVLHNRYYNDSNIRFFEKYPDVGLWILFTCLVVSVYFIFASIFVSDIYNYKNIIKDASQSTGLSLSSKKIVGSILFAFILVFIFIGIQFITVYDTSIVPGPIFIEKYKAKFFFFLTSGGIVSSLFFGGYVTMGEVLKEITLMMAKKNRQKAKLEAVATRDQDQEDQLNNIKTSLASLDHICGVSIQNLNKYFYTTSFILTAVVVVTGTLFTAVNNIDILKLYSYSFGSDFLNYDMIYLFGGLYSLLILFFYLPLRLVFSQMKEKYPEASDHKVQEERTPSKTSFYTNKDFLNRLKETFAVSTPLLAAIIQFVIDIVSSK